MSNTEAMRAEFEAWAERERFELLRFSDDYLYTETKGAWHGWQAASAGKAELLEAVKALLCMLPSDHEERPEAERIPSSYCYVRWKEIREARAAISRATGEQDTGRESNG